MKKSFYFFILILFGFFALYANTDKEENYYVINEINKTKDPNFDSRVTGLKILTSKEFKNGEDIFIIVNDKEKKYKKYLNDIISILVIGNNNKITVLESKNISPKVISIMKRKEAI